MCESLSSVIVALVPWAVTDTGANPNLFPSEAHTIMSPRPVVRLARGMMMNTKVTGAYHGPEEQLGRNECYTEINVTSNYAPTATTEILVVDSDGIPVAGGHGEFKPYNNTQHSRIRAMRSAESASAIPESDANLTLSGCEKNVAV